MFDNKVIIFDHSDQSTVKVDWIEPVQVVRVAVCRYMQKSENENCGTLGKILKVCGSREATPTVEKMFSRSREATTPTVPQVFRESQRHSYSRTEFLMCLLT